MHCSRHAQAGRNLIFGAWRLADSLLPSSMGQFTVRYEPMSCLFLVRQCRVPNAADPGLLPQSVTSSATLPSPVVVVFSARPDLNPSRLSAAATLLGKKMSKKEKKPSVFWIGARDALFDLETSKDILRREADLFKIPCLKVYDRDIMVSNIMLLLEDKKDLVGFNHCSCLEPACSCNLSENTRLKRKKKKKKNMNHNCNMKGNTFCLLHHRNHLSWLGSKFSRTRTSALLSDESLILLA
ncbi:uncharacterized protein LOC122032849 [Zingiber officinale]|uniref:uncharacterized protein LOC122032849 n=1 Tax=Zingiber officinale TaxID=94328 RepID=UPI001C4CB28A|nr:uncharacterized protein LOC122032849 [Zingiber officinale]